MADGAREALYGGGLAECRAEGRSRLRGVPRRQGLLWRPANYPDDCYTLGFVPEDIPKLAYAAGFGVERLTARQRRAAAGFLRRFDWISARERSGAALVQELADREVPLAVDPALFLPPGEWRALARPAPPPGGYLLCYLLGKTPTTGPLPSACGRRAACPLRRYPTSTISSRPAAPARTFPFMICRPNSSCRSSAARSACLPIPTTARFSAPFGKRLFVPDRFPPGTRGSTNTRLDTLPSLLGLEGRRVSPDIPAAGMPGPPTPGTATRLAALRKRSPRELRGALARAEILRKD